MATVRGSCSEHRLRDAIESHAAPYRLNEKRRVDERARRLFSLQHDSFVEEDLRRMLVDELHVRIDDFASQTHQTEDRELLLLCQQQQQREVLLPHLNAFPHLPDLAFMFFQSNGMRMSDSTIIAFVGWILDMREGDERLEREKFEGIILLDFVAQEEILLLALYLGHERQHSLLRQNQRLVTFDRLFGRRHHVEQLSNAIDHFHLAVDLSFQFRILEEPKSRHAHGRMFVPR